MIKPEELRIGNCFFNQTTVRECVGVLEDRIYYWDREISILKPVWQSVELLDPIPITEEWLKRFGFSIEGTELGDEGALVIEDPILAPDYYEELIMWTPKGKGRRYIEDMDKDTINVLQNYDKRMSHIKYVHQLQNLYFALTGSELTLKN